MRDSTYSALFGALSNEMRMASIANNLANVNTTAYKKDQMAFHDTFTRFAHDYLVDSKPFVRDKELFPQGHIMAKARLSDQQTDFSQGSLQKTGNPLDLALTGEGFFKVQVGGEVLYTRAGNFLVDSGGTMMTQDGNPVLVDGGPAILPPGAKVSIDQNGGLSVNGDPAGSFDIVTFDNIGLMEKVGSNYYRPKEGENGAETEATDVTVQQGFIEKGNVEVVSEMVAMIETQRAFTMYSKMIQTTDQMDTKMITKIGRPSI